MENLPARGQTKGTYRRRKLVMDLKRPFVQVLNTTFLRSTIHETSEHVRGVEQGVAELKASLSGTPAAGPSGQAGLSLSDRVDLLLDRDERHQRQLLDRVTRATVDLLHAGADSELRQSDRWGRQEKHLKTILGRLELFSAQTVNASVGALIREENVRHLRALGAMISLDRLVLLKFGIPSMADAGPGYLLMVVEIILDRRPRLVVELGSGGSTLVVASALRRTEQAGTLVSWDESSERVNFLRRRARAEGLESVVDVREWSRNPEGPGHTPMTGGGVDILLAGTVSNEQSLRASLVLFQEQLTRDSLVVVKGGAPASADLTEVANWGASLGYTSVLDHSVEDGVLLLTKGEPYLPGLTAAVHCTPSDGSEAGEVSGS